MPLTEATLEPRIQQLGRELFTKVRGKKQRSAGAWWNSKLIEQSLKDEALKVQLFRFTDVLPTLKDSKQVARHLNEYFNAPGMQFPSFLSWGASLAGFSSIAASVGAMAIRKSVEDMAMTFISGSTPAEAIKAAANYRKKNLTVTFDLLGEAVVSEPEADEYFQKYLALLKELTVAAPKWSANPLLDTAASGAIPRINLSVKLSSLFSQLDPIDPAGSEKGLAPRLEELFDRAIAANAFINIDMEDYRLKDLTLQIFKDFAGSAKYRAYRHFGIVLQAYLKETERDLKELAVWAIKRGTPVTVRLVKGAYWDYENIHARQHGWPVPVFAQKWETDANFEACARILIESYPHLECALGSHNVRSIVAGLAAAEALKQPQNALEIQGLYGMADPLKEALAESSYRVRVYMPFGELLPGMAYLVRRLLENTANDSFLRQGFVEGVSEDKLLAKPSGSNGRAKAQYLGQGSAVKGFVNHPEQSFYHADERNTMVLALKDVRGKFGQSWPLVIGGKTIKGDEPEIVSHNPSNLSEVVGRVSSASVGQTEQAIAAAKKAFPAWRDTDVKSRADLLRKAAQIMIKRMPELCAWEIFEAGKPWREADGDVAEAIDFLNYYGLQAETLMRGTKREQVPGEVNENFYQPRGVAAIIAPWNFPLAILTGKTAAALATGNTVLIKPAEQTPVIGALLMQILREAGIPDGVANFVPGDGAKVGAHMVTHPDVNLIAFTGSREVGLWINAEAAKTRQGQQGVKKVICEMGGKNAIIVDDDADLDEAVLGVVQSAFGYAGQKCSACSRAIVVSTAYEPFVRRLQEAVASIKVAAAEDPGCRVPPVIDPGAQKNIDNYIEIGKKEAKLALQVDVAELRKLGSFVGPTVFIDVPPNARIAQEEIFGPVLAVIKATDFDQALSIALDIPFALTGAIYSRSPGNIEKARTGFRVGNLYINRGSTGAKVDRQPFGGFKMSGIGSKAGGPDYLLQFVEPRTVTENTLRRGFAPTSDEPTAI
ncbi:MAG TPA: L-glutamate gamma-semialdehyde dehydrogenase [Planctomycetota bacterium]|nr:L-glutamate gamma-semialdehyde dehydrogenase [Planctomycetota bacterium]